MAGRDAPLPQPERQKREARPDKIADIRFDAILVAPGRLPRHIPAVFETS